jgi:Uma2 family endonuclease
MPDGSVELDEVPLTLEDVLHPQEGDVIPETPIHELDCGYLADVFRSRPVRPPVSWVTADLLVNWGIPGLRNHSPDLAVFVGMREEPDLQKGTLDLVASGGRCVLVVEVVSPNTRDNDVVRKREHYHRAQVPLYAIVDQEVENGPRRLLALRYAPAGYQEIPLDEQDRVLLEPLGLYLQVRDDRVVCQDASTGREVGDYVRSAQELDAANRRNQEQAQVLEDAVLQLRDAARAQREAEATVSTEKAARTAAEAEVRAERAARIAAEERIARLEAALRSAQPNPPA